MSYSGYQQYGGNPYGNEGGYGSANPYGSDGGYSNPYAGQQVRKATGPSFTAPSKDALFFPSPT